MSRQAAERATFCRICEPGCGLIATVEGDRITDVRGDPDNPHSQGFMCVKARAMLDIVDDPDRVLTPLKRVGGPGVFEPVSWDEALDDIASRLKALVDRHGPTAYATFIGNPSFYSAAGSMGAEGLRHAIGSPWNYSINGEDAGAFLAASGLQYGSTALFPRPDVWRTDFLLMLGSNPWVSKGSPLSEPLIRPALRGIVERGGRVVVVDPRRTETAERFEHIALQPGTDPWLLLGMLGVIVADGLVDRAFIERWCDGYDDLARITSGVDLATCAERSGVPAATIERLAVGFATAPSAAAYGRTGTCTQRFGTLTNLLINALNVVTGNLNREGGSMFAWCAIDFVALAKAGGMDAYAEVRTRAQGLPATYGVLPSQGLWRDILEPGDGQIRALLTYAANPVISSGAGGPRLEEALQHLDLHFSLDLYVNETNKHAHYILPSPTFYERADIPLLGMMLAVRPSLYASEKVIEPRGDTRHEWWVLNEIAKRMGLGGAQPVKLLRLLAKLGIHVDPIRMLDLAIRTGPVGDRFGLRRGGWSLAKLRRRAPHGVSLRDHLPVQDLGNVLQTPERRIRLAPAELAEETTRLVAHADDDAYPLRAITLRETGSQNTWMHNAPRLTPVRRTPQAHLHPADAAAAGLPHDGADLRIESEHGTIVMSAKVTDAMRPGTVAIPHGWGHAGGWRRANAAGGANSNLLASASDEDIERLAGMSILNGIPVRVSAVAPPGDEAVPSR